MTNIVRQSPDLPRQNLAKTNKGSRRTPKNGSARRGANGNGVASATHQVDLEAEELAVLVKACKKYRASLPGYLASAQDDVARAEYLIDKLASIIKKHAR
ncbi:MAG: hypothetical protein E2P02_08715 [Acidobacteria bacterium]|nr:MAG: hypothetical protein E2P02_08715 [Acidobacteriota bacterium]